jgi:hypothetical protein
MESTILLAFSDDKYSIINEKLRYKIVITKKPRIVKASWKLNGAGYGFKFGFNLEKDITGKDNPAGSDPGKENLKKEDLKRENFEEAVSDKENMDRGYDCIVGVETRILKGKIGSLSEAEDSWRNEFGRDNFKREEVLRKEDRAIYTYTYSDGVPFSGIEGIYINGKVIHIVRVLCSSSIKERVFEEILKPVEEMVLVK